jgi:hypothetical protein
MPRIASAVTKLALLIDGDNVSASYMPLIMREAELIGVVAIRRIYGQFKSGKMKSWLKQLETFDLTSVNVSPLTRGKNATDMKLVIEAMDMLNGRQLDGFLIASSDGDFTPLVARIRASAVACYGFGMKKAPAAYKAEFDRFFECDTALAAEKKAAPRRPAMPSPEPSSPAPVRAASRQTSKPAVAKSAKRSPQPSPKPAPSKAAPEMRPDDIMLVPRDALLDAILKTRGDDGWSHFRDVGQQLSQKGYKKSQFKLPALRRQYGDAFEVEQRGTEKYVRPRENRR